MAIIPESQYPGKIAPADSEYPYGKARNITLPGDGTGTPWEAALVNDLFGFQQALLEAGEVTPSGDPETATESQYLAAIRAIFGDRAIAVPSIAELRATDPAETGAQYAFVMGGPTGPFFGVAWNDGSETADDGITTFAVTGVPVGRWQRVSGSVSSVADFRSGTDFDLDDPNLPSGWYTVSSGHLGTYPAGASTTATLEVVDRLGTTAFQRWRGNDGAEFSRHYDGTWTDWKGYTRPGDDPAPGSQPITSETRITNNGDGGGALTPLSVVFDDGTIVSIFRVSLSDHGIQEGSYPAMVKSTDNGRTWTDPVPVVQNASYDLRNYGGGIAPNGDLILFYSRRASGGTDEAGYIISSDQGETWGTPQILSGIASVPTVHAKFAVFGTTIVQPMLGDNPGRGIWVARSTDNGQNWSIEEIYTAADASAIGTGGALNETTIVATSATDGLILTRNEGGEPDFLSALGGYTTDGGATWSTLQSLQSPMGSQPPTTYFDGNYIWHLWPNRKGDDRGIDAFDSTYHVALLHKDNLTTPNKFREPAGIPIGIPQHGAGQGDSGYGNVIEINGRPYMIYYKGHFNDNGCDLYIAPITGV